MTEQQRLSPIAAVICVPTFRRVEGLRRTLQSVIAQRSDVAFAVVVVDNDGADPRGAALAREMLATAGVSHTVLVEPEQGNCHAINRAFGAAVETYPTADFFIMIDDDEIALPGWLQALVDLSRTRSADLVGGPVFREFEVRPAAAVTRHPLFVSIDGETRPIDQLHGSGNCLIHRRVFERFSPRPFDLRFNFLGGGDMEFFTRCRLAGLTTWWCAEAVVHEFVAPDRITATFLTKRSIRTGSINYLVDRLHKPRGVVLLKNVASLALGIARSLKTLIRTGSPLLASHPVLMSAGRIIASLGFLPKPYKSPP